MKTKNEITFFTYADEKYYPFVLPYVFSILKNTNADVVVVLENENDFFNTYGKKWANISYNIKLDLNQQWSLYAFDKNGVIPNTVRFLTSPKRLVNKYTYITDVDIIVTKTEYEKAIKNNIDNLKSCFFNILRDSGPKLSGMHFVETKKWYPKLAQYLKNFEDISKINQFGDEGFLYKMVQETIGDPEKLTEGNKRIMPGYHLSPNRNKKYTEIKAELCKDPAWEYAFTQFSPEFLKMF